MKITLVLSLLATTSLFAGTSTFTSECVNYLEAEFLNTRANILKKSESYYDCSPNRVQHIKDYINADNEYDQLQIQYASESSLEKKNLSTQDEIAHICSAIDKELNLEFIQGKNFRDIEWHFTQCHINGWPYLHSLALRNIIKDKMIQILSDEKK